MIGRDEAARVAASALGEYPGSGKGEIVFVKQRENVVFRVDADNGTFALRIHRRDYHSDDQLLEELHMLAGLRGAGFPVPRVRPTASGALLCDIMDGEGRTHQVDMIEWIDGAAPLGDIGEAFTGVASVEPGTFQALGRLIADLHTASSTLGRDAPSVRRAWDHQGLVGERCVWGDPRRAFAVDSDEYALVDKAMERLSIQLGTFGALPGRSGPIHADFTPENVLVDGDRMAVIDFDDCGDGYYLFDLATAAFWYLPHPRATEIVDALLAGYCEVRPLDADDRAVWEAMLLARGLTYLGWAADRLGDPTSAFIQEEVCPLVMELATDFVAGVSG